MTSKFYIFVPSLIINEGRYKKYTEGGKHILY